MCELTEEQYNMAERLSDRAYSTFSSKHKPCQFIKNPFPMYSYERAGIEFWHSVIQVMISKGLTEGQVEWLLRHKYMSLRLDSFSFEEVAKEFVTDEMIKAAKAEYEGELK